MHGKTYDVLSTQQVTSTGTANLQSLAIPTGARALLISVETTDARMTFDGSTPGTTNGHVIKAGVNPFVIELGGAAIAPVVQFKSTAGANSIVDVTYLG